MKVRALDNAGDWTFGRGANNYLGNNEEVAQDIETRLRSYLGDCFFDVKAGLDWFNLNGSKDQRGLNLAVSAVILNTPNVLGLKQLNVFLNRSRGITLTYSVNTTFPGLLRQTSAILTTEDGDILTTEDGDSLET